MASHTVQYGVRVERADQIRRWDDPRSAVRPGWRGALPAGPHRACYFGTEFCEHLVPSLAAARAVCEGARQLDLEPVLLTPVVTPAGLERVAELFGGLSRAGCAPAVTFNDWGVLELLRRDHPAWPRHGGRLLNRGLRDPRLAESREPGAAPAAGEEPPRRNGRLRSLLGRCGAVALETDADLEPGHLGAGSEGLRRTLHLPFVFAASGRHCLPRSDARGEGRGGYGADLGGGCRAPCLGSGPHQEARTDLATPLWRRGNTLFYEAPRALARSHLAQADRVVLHGRPAP